MADTLEELIEEWERRRDKYNCNYKDYLAREVSKCVLDLRYTMRVMEAERVRREMAG